MVHPPHLIPPPYHELLFIRLDYDEKLSKTGKIKIKKYFDYNQNLHLDEATLRWYDTISCFTVDETSEKNRMRTPHWRIKSGNLELFTIKKIVFQSIDLFYGFGTASWRFSIHTPEDKFKLYTWWGVLALGYTAPYYCQCVGNHFMQTIADIKNELINRKEDYVSCAKRVFLELERNSEVCEIFLGFKQKLPSSIK